MRVQAATFRRCVKWMWRRYRTPRLNHLSPFHVELKRQHKLEAEAAAVLARTVTMEGDKSEQSAPTQPRTTSRRSTNKGPTEAQLQRQQAMMHDPKWTNMVRERTCVAVWVEFALSPHPPVTLSLHPASAI